MTMRDLDIQVLRAIAKAPASIVAQAWDRERTPEQLAALERARIAGAKFLARKRK